jgi:PAS domain S-box-containing protein
MQKNQSMRLSLVALNTKTIFLILFGFFCIVFSSLLVIRSFFLLGIDTLETEGIHKASAQAKASIYQLISHQEALSYDWAHWDESYYLLKQGDKNFAARNFSTDGLNALNIDLMAFISKDLRPIEFYGREDKAKINDFLHQMLRDPCIDDYFTHYSGDLIESAASKSGLLKFDRALWGISITPIRDSLGTSNVSGWLIFAHNLTAHFHNDFVDSSSTVNSLLTLGDVAIAEPTMSGEKLVSQLFKHEDIMYQYTPLNNMASETVAYIKTSQERRYYEQGNSMFNHIMLILVLLGVVISFITLILFSRKIGYKIKLFENGINRLIDKQSQFHNITDSSLQFEQLIHWLGGLSDQENRGESYLNDVSQKFNALYQSKILGMLIIIDRKIVDVNYAFLAMLQYSRDEILGLPLDSLCQPDEQGFCCSTPFYQQLEHGNLTFEVAMTTKKGEALTCSVEAALIQQQGKTAYMVSIKDISTQLHQEQLISELIERDYVSGFFNRPAIARRIDEIIVAPSLKVKASEHQFTLLHLHFKGLNDMAEVYGSDTYEKVITYISSDVRAYFGDVDVGRLSEQEFIIVGLDKEYEELFQLKASQLSDKYRRLIGIDDYEVKLDMHAVVLPSYLNLSDFESYAQTAMYSINKQRALHKHLRVSVVTEELSQTALVAIDIERDLTQAIKNQQFIAYFQPIVDGVTGLITSFEALARWDHPRYGMITPDLFIPLAEKRELIIELGEQILSQACQFIHELEQCSANTSRSLSVHVNLSSQHFYHRNLIKTLNELLDTWQLRPSQLVLELTESVLIGIESDTIDRMNRIKDLGVQLALDDFGTGYSSFSMLCDFPLDIVKLDRSYIEHLDSNDKATVVIRSILSMAKELGLTSVAEGVETSAQLRKLKVWNVDEIQGFYFYKPMSKNNIFSMFAQRAH